METVTVEENLASKSHLQKNFPKHLPKSEIISTLAARKIVATTMIPRISKMEIHDDYVIYVEFDDGLPGYRALAEECGLFKQARIDSSRTCVYWNDEIDLPSDSIYEYGTAL